MLLTIDIGNTNASIGFFDETGQLVFVSAMETDRNKTSDQYAVDIMNIFKLNSFNIKKVGGTIISSVVPSVVPAFEAAVLRLTGSAPMLVGPGIKTGLNILIDLHTQLGSDIVAAAVAALGRYRPPMILIDMGTATTISALNRAGAFMGCAIFPGVRLAMDALSEHTAQLPHISIEEPEGAIGKNTVDSMRAGVIYGNAGMIDSMVERFEKEIGAAAAIIATGGNAKHILKHCRHNIVYDENLLMHGLYLIYMKNSDKGFKKTV